MQDACSTTCENEGQHARMSPLLGRGTSHSSQNSKLGVCDNQRRKGQLLLEIYGIGTSPTTTLVLPTDDEGVTDATYAEHFQLASAMSKPRTQPQPPQRFFAKASHDRCTWAQW